MWHHDQGKTFTRRSLLKVLAGAGVAAHGSGSLLHANKVPHCAPALKANLINIVAAAESAPRFFSPAELRSFTAVCEAIIPADDHSPGATAAGVPAYADSFLAAASEERRSDWKAGLAAIDRVAEEEFTRKFADCSTEEQEQILTRISANEDRPATPTEKFFVAAKHLTIEGYYNSKLGLDVDLQFIGNEALAEFEGCTHPEHGAPERVKG